MSTAGIGFLSVAASVFLSVCSNCLSVCLSVCLSAWPEPVDRGWGGGAVVEGGLTSCCLRCASISSSEGISPVRFNGCMARAGRRRCVCVGGGGGGRG